MNNAWANQITEAAQDKVVNDLRFTPERQETLAVMAARKNDSVVPLLVPSQKIKPKGKGGGEGGLPRSRMASRKAPVSVRRNFALLQPSL